MKRGQISSKRKWREYYILDNSDYRELQAAWNGHGRSIGPGRRMVFYPPSLMVTNLIDSELRAVLRLSFVRGKLPDYVTTHDPDLPDEES